ncbi:MAG: hypothetical protein K2X44_08585 [Magnetospirillum sp.]|nr:hypothetical protein [Magnetospirillum sp.]
MMAGQTAAMTDDVALVACHIHDITRVANHAHLLALASANMEIDGVSFRLDGIQVVTARARGFPTVQVKLPTYRGADGVWRPAIVLPPELERPLGDAVLAAYRALD